MRCALYVISYAAAACALCLSACEPAHLASQQRPQASSIAFNISEEPHSLNPILAQNDDERQIAHLMFDLLLDVDANGRQIPGLAVAVPDGKNGGVSRDGRTITYHLRRGLFWQDGAPLTSRDVRFTWHAIMAKENDVQSVHGYDIITAIDTPDDDTAIIHLAHAWAPAVATFFTYGTNPMPIVPAHLLEGKGSLRESDFNSHPVGSGPYTLRAWDRGNRLTFKANRRYFRGAPKTETIVAQEVTDLNTDLTMLRGGQLDWSLLSPAQRLSLAAARGLHFVYAPFSGFGAIAFNCRQAPFVDVRMRRALAQAIDRRRLSDSITRGQYPVTDSDQPAFSWALDPAVRLPPYDPAAADRSLDALGWPRARDGMRRKQGRALNVVFVTFPEGDTAVRTAEYVQQMLRERGIAVSVKKVTVTQFYLPRSEHGLLMSGGFDMAYIAWRTGEDPDDSDVVTCRGPANYAGYCSPSVDALERRAVTTDDRGARRALYFRIQRALATDVPYDYLYAPRYSFAARDGLRGFDPSPLSPTWNAYAWSMMR
ncbi:MAG: peptide ABC transporter substrate-binding protein [Candidatus Eremiobacteraeota bacterium]|nr:peptide ABC transporter substrate-binding protein [Candidatus Eremiobacteraeota bacterium]MBC5828201.1 peptide ABC transporter substrate-binding protein [Candidatus Eremiobacteraeota bacterium]